MNTFATSFKPVNIEAPIQKLAVDENIGSILGEPREQQLTSFGEGHGSLVPTVRGIDNPQAADGLSNMLYPRGIMKEPDDAKRIHGLPGISGFSQVSSTSFF